MEVKAIAIATTAVPVWQWQTKRKRNGTERHRLPFQDLFPNRKEEIKRRLEEGASPKQAKWQAGSGFLFG